MLIGLTFATLSCSTLPTKTKREWIYHDAYKHINISVLTSTSTSYSNAKYTWLEDLVDLSIHAEAVVWVYTGANDTSYESKCWLLRYTRGDTQCTTWWLFKLMVCKLMHTMTRLSLSEENSTRKILSSLLSLLLFPKDTFSKESTSYNDKLLIFKLPTEQQLQLTHTITDTTTWHPPLTILTKVVKRFKSTAR